MRHLAKMTVAAFWLPLLMSCLGRLNARGQNRMFAIAGGIITVSAIIAIGITKVIGYSILSELAGGIAVIAFYIAVRGPVEREFVRLRDQK